MTLISITFNSPQINEEPTRWQDNINLFEYGFENYAYRSFFTPYDYLGEIYIYDPPLGDDGIMHFFATEHGAYLLSYAELNRLERQIIFTPQLLHTVYDTQGEHTQMLLTPIEENQAIGTLEYLLDGEVIFTAAIYAARYVEIRTPARDIDHFLTRINEIFFSASAVPFWIAGVSVAILMTVLIILARKAIKRNKRNYKYKWK